MLQENKNNYYSVNVRITEIYNVEYHRLFKIFWNIQVSNLYAFKQYIATCKYSYTYVTTTTEEEVRLTIWFHV